MRRRLRFTALAITAISLFIILTLAITYSQGNAEVSRKRNLQYFELHACNADVVKLRNYQCPELSRTMNSDIIKLRNYQCLELAGTNADVIKLGNYQYQELKRTMNSDVIRSRNLQYFDVREREPHDVAVNFVTTSKTVVGEGYSVKIKPTGVNLGTYTETFNVTACYNETAIILPNGKNYTTITLASGNCTTLTFTWNTTGVTYGNYSISASAAPVPGETHTADNTLTDGWVVVTIPGDIDGNYKVNHKDLLLLASAYGSEVGGPRYIPEADIDCSSKVDHKDLLILAANYGMQAFS